MPKQGELNQRACEACHRKKTKCRRSSENEKCEHCLKNSISCVPYVALKRGRKKAELATRKTLPRYCFCGELFAGKRFCASCGRPEQEATSVQELMAEVLALRKALQSATAASPAPTAGSLTSSHIFGERFAMESHFQPSVNLWFMLKTQISSTGSYWDTCTVTNVSDDFGALTRYPKGLIRGEPLARSFCHPIVNKLHLVSEVKTLIESEEGVLPLMTADGRCLELGFRKQSVQVDGAVMQVMEVKKWAYTEDPKFGCVSYNKNGEKSCSLFVDQRGVTIEDFEANFKLSKPHKNLNYSIPTMYLPPRSARGTFGPMPAEAAFEALNCNLETVMPGTTSPQLGVPGESEPEGLLSPEAYPTMSLNPSSPSSSAVEPESYSPGFFQSEYNLLQNEPGEGLFDPSDNPADFSANLLTQFLDEAGSFTFVDIANPDGVF